MNYDCDHALFLALNFDGGPAMDAAMKFISGNLFCGLLYAVLLWTVYRRAGARRLLLFVALLALALTLTDMFCGIFKHSGVLKHLWPSFPPRLRPMFTEELLPLIHVPYPGGGLYGTVSAHAATNAAMLLLSASVIRRRWAAWLCVIAFAAICYSRIYLAKHFPIDLLLGAAAGLAAGAAFAALYRWADRRMDRRMGNCK